MALRDQGCCKSSPTRTFCTRQQPLFCAPPLEEVSPAPRGVIPPARAAEKFIGHMLGRADFEGIVGRRASAPSSTRAATKACRQHWASHHAARNIQRAQLTQGHRLPQANGDGEMVVRNCSDVINSMKEATTGLAVALPKIKFIEADTLSTSPGASDQALACRSCATYASQWAVLSAASRLQSD